MFDIDDVVESGADLSTMPQFEINNFALWLAKTVEAYYKDPEHQREFEEWEKEKYGKTSQLQEQDD